MTPHEDLKRRTLLTLLKMLAIGAIVVSIIHFLEGNTPTINLIVPPFVAISFSLLFIRLSQKPESLYPVTRIFALILALSMSTAVSYFVWQAIAVPNRTLIETLPAPVVASLPLFSLIILVFLRPHQLGKTLFSSWFITVSPILFYLLLHPGELRTLRGQEIFILTGPVIAGQIVFILFHVRLQDLVDRLYTERLQYYSQILEKQAIRQQAIEQTFTQIHNGPLQTLAVLLRDVRGQNLQSPELLERLEELNEEIRAVGSSLTGENNPSPNTGKISITLTETPSTWILRLGEGHCLDLNLPLNELFYQVFSITIKRDLPHFKTLRVKMRNFAVLSGKFDLDQKRELCMWLEEAVCNVGKHAEGVTRIKATGEIEEGQYILTVQDNGCGLKTPCTSPSQNHNSKLAQRLEGKFWRESLRAGGTICQLSWPL